jgi:hypothetical protein
MADRLAPELIVSILKYAHPQTTTRSESRPGVETLLSCCLVSRHWSSISQLLLFREVILFKRSSAISFQIATDHTRPKGPLLASSIRSLEIEVWDETGAGNGLGVSQRQFAQIVRLCTQLKTLVVIYYAKQELHHTTLNILRSSPPPQTLCVRTSQRHYVLWDLLELWPSIEFLMVDSTDIGSDAHAPPSFRARKPPPGWAPSELRLLQHLSSEYAGNLLTLLATSLRILELQVSPPLPIFGHLSKVYGSTIRSLRLSAVSDETAPCLSNFTVLEEFKLDGTPSLHVLDNLSLGLLHLQFQYQERLDKRPSSIQHIIDFIFDRQQLRTLTFYDCASANRDELTALESICQYRGIQFKCYVNKARNVAVRLYSHGTPVGKMIA